MSSFRSTEFQSADEAQLSVAAGTNAVASLQAGHPFSLLLSADERQRTAGLESLMDAIADTGTRFIVATNPLRARLTLERLLIQVIGGEPYDALGDQGALIRRIAERRGEETRVILVIEQAETLHPEVLRFLGQTASLFPDATPRLQVLFVGRPEFRLMLDDPDAGLDEQTAQLEAYRPREPEPSFGHAPELEMTSLPPRPILFQDDSLRSQIRAVWNRGLMVQTGIVGGTLVGAAAIVFAVFIALTGNEIPPPAETVSAMLELPEQQSEPDPPALQPGPAPDAATAALRREFDAYLIASGRDMMSGTPGQRRAIFQEFMVWRARTTGAKPAQ